MTIAVVLIIAGVVIVFVSFIFALLNMLKSAKGKSIAGGFFAGHIGAMIGMVIGGLMVLIGLAMGIIPYLVG